jgi:hypothetical protein
MCSIYIFNFKIRWRKVLSLSGCFFLGTLLRCCPQSVFEPYCKIKYTYLSLVFSLESKILGLTIKFAQHGNKSIQSVPGV